MAKLWPTRIIRFAHSYGVGQDFARMAKAPSGYKNYKNNVRRICEPASQDIYIKFGYAEF